MTKMTPKAKPLTWRQALKVVDETLARGDRHSASLWHVLTALRGPDSGAYGQKQEMTIPIRRKALPKTTRSGKSPADFGSTSSLKTVNVDMVISHVYIDRHFLRHAKWAAEVLGISQ